MKHMNKGFTLIELVIVIVILGILAATALPRFVDLQGDARQAAVEGLGGGVNAAASLAHAKALVDDVTGATGSISMDGQSINMVFGWPEASVAGIQNSLQGGGSGLGQFTTSSTASTYTFQLRANCNVVYTEAASATTAASVAVTTSGCN